METWKKSGSCCIKEYEYSERAKDKILKYNGDIVRTHWIIDTEIPIFKGEGREYIERLINY